MLPLFMRNTIPVCDNFGSVCIMNDVRMIILARFIYTFTCECAAANRYFKIGVVWRELKMYDPWVGGWILRK